MSADMLLLGFHPERTGPRRERGGVRQRTISTRAGRPLSKLGESAPTLSRNWVEMPNFHDAKGMHAWWLQQQKNRRSEPEDRDAWSDTIEPPFPLEVLTILAIENPDFYAIVDQLATDTAGLGWRIIDRKEIPQAEAEVVEDAAAAQRVEAETFLNRAAVDRRFRSMTLKQVFKAVVIDKKTTGNGYVEVSSEGDPGNPTPTGLFHVASRNVRRLKSGGWKQISDTGQNIAVFRDWGSDPGAPDSIVTAAEAEKYKNATEGELKNEMKAFWSYHAADSHYGIPAAIAALRSIFGTIYAENRNLRFFINRGLPDWVIEIRSTNENLSDPEVRTTIDDIAESIEAHMKYLLEGEDHRALLNEIPTDVLEVKWERLGEAVKDQDFPTYRLDNRDTTLRVYRMLPSRLGIIETANLGTGSGETQAETYKSSVIDPEQTEIEEFIDEVLDRLGLSLVRFKWNEMDVVDELRESQILSALGPYLTVNEGRAMIASFLPDLELKPYLDDDRADIPQKLLELQMGVSAPAGLGGFGLSADHPALPAGAGAVRFLPMPHEVDPSYRNIARRLNELQALPAGEGRADGGTR